MKLSPLPMLQPKQDPLVQELLSHYHLCRVKDDTLYSIVYHTTSGLELFLQRSLLIWNGCTGLYNS